MAKPGPLSGLQLLTRLPSLMAITCSGLHAHLPLAISLQVAESVPFSLHPPSKLRQYSSHCHYNIQ